MDEYLFPLKGRQMIAEGTMAFTFDTTDSNFSFRAGQYIDMTLIDPPQTDSEGNTRTFSISSPPSKPGSIMITTRIRGSAFKNNLLSMPLGTKVKIKGPMGSFVLHSHVERPAMFVVGGIGITPVRSIVMDALERNLSTPLYLFYSNANPQTTAFLSEFEDLATHYPNFHFIPTITDVKDDRWTYETGRIDEAMIKKHLPNASAALAYIVGPPAMVAAMIAVVHKVGVVEDSVRTEEFAGY